MDKPLSGGYALVDKVKDTCIVGLDQWLQGVVHDERDVRNENSGLRRVGEDFIYQGIQTCRCVSQILLIVNVIRPGK